MSFMSLRNVWSVCVSAVNYFNLDHFSHFNPAAHFSFRQLKVKDVSIPSSGSKLGQNVLHHPSIKIQGAVTNPLCSFVGAILRFLCPRLAQFSAGLVLWIWPSVSRKRSARSDFGMTTWRQCGPHDRTTLNFPSTEMMSEVLIRLWPKGRPTWCSAYTGSHQKPNMPIMHKFDKTKNSSLFDNLASRIQHNLYMIYILYITLHMTIETTR